MVSSTLVLYRDTNAPPSVINTPDVDWTGSTAEVKIRATAGATPVVLTSASGAVTIDVPGRRLLVDHDAALVGNLPVGDQARWGAFRLFSGDREYVGGGVVMVGDLGGASTTTEASVAVVQGPPGEQGDSVSVTLVENANWPPAADANPLHLYVRVL